MRIRSMVLLWLVACGAADPADPAESADPADSDSDGATDGASCEPHPADPDRYVIVGFWNNDPTCTGDPMITNAFPVDASEGCYCWPGASGENSADTFACDPAAHSFTYTQYNSLTCGLDDDTPTVKTSYTDRCEQDIPANLYAMIVDYGACAP